MVILKLLLELFCIKFVTTSVSQNLPVISFDLTRPLNKVLSGNISKSDFKNTFMSTNFFNDDTGSREIVGLLYAAGRNASNKQNNYPATIMKLCVEKLYFVNFRL